MVRMQDALTKYLTKQLDKLELELKEKSQQQKSITGIRGGGDWPYLGILLQFYAQIWRNCQYVLSKVQLSYDYGMTIPKHHLWIYL